MNDYREAYENYYRNINKKTNVNIQEDKSSFWSKNKVKNYRSNNKIEGLVSKNIGLSVLREKWQDQLLL